MFPAHALGALQHKLTPPLGIEPGVFCERPAASCSRVWIGISPDNIIISGGGESLSSMLLLRYAVLINLIKVALAPHNLSMRGQTKIDYRCAFLVAD